MESFWNSSLAEEELTLRNLHYDITDDTNLLLERADFSSSFNFNAGYDCSIWTSTFRENSHFHDQYCIDVGEKRQLNGNNSNNLSSQKLMRTLGKKEGELEGFRDLLTKAENALRQSEDAVDVSTFT